MEQAGSKSVFPMNFVLSADIASRLVYRITPTSGNGT
jgi:hypothetical protein